MSGPVYFYEDKGPLFKSREIDITNIYWKIPVVEYYKPENGIIKKQMKVIFNTPEEYNAYKETLKTIPYYTEHQLKHIDNPESRKLSLRMKEKLP